MISTLAQLITDYRLDTDKNSTHSYADYFYDHAFAPYRNQPITLIEVGVHQGGSLQLWSSYFSRAHIIGVDINLAPNHTPPLPNVSLIEGDAYTYELFDKLPPCDIFIDDGSHDLDHQCWVAKHYSSRIRSGGLLVIEDVADIAFIDRLQQSVPEQLQPYATCIDLRYMKQRFDDILFVIRIP